MWHNIHVSVSNTTHLVETVGGCGYKAGNSLLRVDSLESQEFSNSFSAVSWGSGLTQGKTLEKVQLSLQQCLCATIAASARLSSMENPPEVFGHRLNLQRMPTFDVQVNSIFRHLNMVSEILEIELKQVPQFSKIRPLNVSTTAPMWLRCRASQPPGNSASSSGSCSKYLAV